MCTAALIAVAAGLPACAPEEAELDQWKITLDFDDGISRDGAIYVDKSQSVELPTGFVREGYSFVGWQTQDGREVSGMFTPTGDVTLVAVWETGTCNVTFSANFEDGESVTREVTYGSVVGDAPAFTREGYVFRYWSTSPDGRNVVDLSALTIESDRTFYAIWREEDIKEFIVTFSPGAYEGAPEATSEVILEGDRVNESDAPRRLSRPGYEFEGWTAEQPEGADWTIDTYPAEGLPELIDFPFVPQSDVTLHAVWTIGRYAAIFNINYTDCTQPNGIYDSAYYLSNQTVQAPAEAPGREHYLFDGWYTAARGGELVNFSQGVKLTANSIYYAHWKHEGVQTDIFQAEYVEFDPNKKYYGYSAEVTGANCIVADIGRAGTVMVDEYPLNSVLTAPRKGHYVSYQYENGCTLRFEIVSSQATTATLIGSFAIESDKINAPIGPDGKYSNLIKVNGQSIDYAPMTLSDKFAEYTLADIQLNEGVNVIEIVVNNSNLDMGSTYRAVSFMTDYIRLENYGTASFRWSPIYDNLEVISKK